jgi:transposase
VILLWRRRRCGKRSRNNPQRAVQAALKHPRGAGLSDSQIAKHVGVTQQTVSNWRKKLESSYKICKIAKRTVTRKGKTYQQRTDNIGKRARGHREGDRGSDRQAAGAEDG